MSYIKISHPTGIVEGELRLTGSKSISNRVLLIRALARSYFAIENLSNSDDTITMEKLLMETSSILDAHHAGTTFRFMTAFLALTTQKEVTLTGSGRMQQRPIKALVDALNRLGANISYTNSEGFPPLIISPSDRKTWKNTISLPADISSQYISALLMIGPYLPNGLKLSLEGQIVSRPYIDMTLGMMKHFGVETSWEDIQTITIRAGVYQAKPYFVEADWSSASYFYSLAALATRVDLKIYGLQKESLQGDAVVAKIYKSLGVSTNYGKGYIQLNKQAKAEVPFLEYDFIRCPDLTQTVAITVGGLGWMGLYTGLQTLYIKETDRVAALKKELAKYAIFLSTMPERFSKNKSITFYSQEGQAISLNEAAVVETYNDHRMAMAFAPLACLFPIKIGDPSVVSKSFPTFWQELRILGFDIE